MRQQFQDKNSVTNHSSKAVPAFFFCALILTSGCTINDPPYTINEEGKRIYNRNLKSAEKKRPPKEEKVETLEIAVNKADTGEDVKLLLTYFVSPRYPKEAEADGLKGDVEVEFRITAEGGTRDVRIIQSDHPGVFDYIVLDVVRRWRFIPQDYPEAYRLILGFEP